MSLIKRSDVKNHLSPRHRSKIHLQGQSTADAVSLKESPPAGSKMRESLADHPDSASSSELDLVPIETPEAPRSEVAGSSVCGTYLLSDHAGKGTLSKSFGR